MTHTLCTIGSVFSPYFFISKHKQAIKEISQKQKIFESLSESLPEVIVLHDEKIIYTNQAFEKLIGYSQELKNKSFIEL